MNANENENENENEKMKKEEIMNAAEEEEEEEEGIYRTPPHVESKGVHDDEKKGYLQQLCLCTCNSSAHLQTHSLTSLSHAHSRC